MQECNYGECPFCGAHETRWVASLGETVHAQCRACGVVFALPLEVEQLLVEETFITYGE
jgi:uncharacterized Zn finger protein